MTLHEAIEKLLNQVGRPMSTKEIANELNKNGWYQKKDGSLIDSFQIHGRTRNYSKLFNRNGSMVSLISQQSLTESIYPKEKKEIPKQANINRLVETKKSFEPISNFDTEILILGTIPGDKSLAKGQYYAHSGNKFWKIIGVITNNPLPEDYSEKKALLLKTKIGIWDVAYAAQRQGSLDSAIENEQPNDLKDFIEKHKNLKVIGFNGQKAEALFDKYFHRQNNIKYVSLPSTSPANTNIGFDRMGEIWKQILIY